MSDNTNIRPVVHADRKYIIQSYLYDMEEAPNFTTAKGSPAPGLVRDDYMGYQHKLIEDFLPRSVGKAAAYMCCEPGANHLYRGYLIAEPYENLPVIHFLKVKKGAQNQGVAKALLARFFKDFGYTPGEHNVVYTHLTKDIHRKRWLQDWIKRNRGVYLPWFVYLAAEQEWDR